MTYLGIDGGGSKTVFLLADEQGHELNRVQSGPSNWLSIGREAAAAAICDGVGKLTGPAPESVCAGFAGAGRPEGRKFYQSVLDPLFPNARVRVESDAFVAYVGAIGLKPGILLIAGTGSIAIGRKADGSMIRVGGWGPHFGDEGGGFWVGRAAVQKALHCLDDQTDLDFPAHLSQKLGVATVRDVVAEWTVPGIAALFPAVAELWPSEPAAEILRQAAAHLRWLTETATERIERPGSPISYAGSVASHPLMQELIGVSFEAPRASAEQGAVMLARSPQGE